MTSVDEFIFGHEIEIENDKIAEASIGNFEFY